MQSRANVRKIIQNITKCRSRPKMWKKKGIYQKIALSEVKYLHVKSFSVELRLYNIGLF